MKMEFRFARITRSFAALIAAVALSAVVGCGKGDAPTASINGEKEKEKETGKADNARGRDNGNRRDDDKEREQRRAERRKFYDNSHPKVLIHTTLGDITVKLDGRRAPLTVDAFMTYVDNGHYNGTVFHQVWNDFILLGGGYNSSMEEKKVLTQIRNEAHNGLKNRKGTIAMARDPALIDSSTCQFFINVNDNPKLDHKGTKPEEYGYCVFGEVIEGMDVIEKINRVQVQNTDSFEKIPVRTVMIETMKRMQ